jgi:hypothetical protein
MNPQSHGPWALPCPVCGRPVPDSGPGPCPVCGLPAVGQAALVVARIGTTLSELSRDRDALLATLRATAPYSSTGPAVPAPSPATAPPRPLPWGAPLPSERPPRHRLSPQQVLLALGGLLVVAAAITFAAVAWTRLGLVFQAGVMLTVTGLLCATSAWTARRGLRATEETLAAAGTALLVVDLTAARALGLFRLEDVDLRTWTACSAAVVVLVCVALSRLTRSTVVWPLAAQLAAQPLPFLLLPEGTVSGPAGVAVALAVAGADLLVATRLRRSLRPVALVLAASFAAHGAAGGLAVAAGNDAVESWTATGLLVLAASVALVLTRSPRPAPLPRPAVVGGLAAAVSALSATASLQRTGEPGAVVATAAGLALLTAAVLLTRHLTTTAVLVSGGTTAALAGAALLLDDGRLRPLALLALAATAPAVLAALRAPGLRTAATGAALLAPGLAVLLAHADGRLAASAAGLLLALLAAAAFAVAAARAGRPEEQVAALGGALAGLAAGATSATVGAWGQVGIHVAVVGVAAGCYGLVGRRPIVRVLAVGDLVLASWIAVGGAGVETPEAYTLPSAVGLLAVALPQLRGARPSWAAEGAAVGVALVPSALTVVAAPTAVRLVLVVAGAVVLMGVGTLAHRQAPFVLGAGALLFVVVARLAPYAPLLPRWVTLATAGLVLLVLGATYERRRQQAREAVAWVAQMR